MKKLIGYLIPICIAVAAILFLEPLLNQKTERHKYDFSVSTHQGIVTKENFKGKVLAIYFGYTFCPDVCPTSLGSLSQALKGLTQKQLQDFQGLFISVDPDRDTLENLESYAHYFHNNFIGATSTKENIDDITKRYGTFYEKIYLKDSQMNYSVSHTSYIYLFDKEGNFVKRIEHFSDPKEIYNSLVPLF